MPELGSVSATIGLAERLRLFDIDRDDLAVAQRVWELIEPEAARVAQIHWEQWARLSGGQNKFVGTHADEEVIRRGIDYLRNRFTRPGELAWVQSAERTVGAAASSGVPLTSILSMTGAGGAETLRILDRRYDCSKEERHRINEAIERLRSLECYIYASHNAA